MRCAGRRRSPSAACSRGSPCRRPARASSRGLRDGRRIIRPDIRGGQARPRLTLGHAMEACAVRRQSTRPMIAGLRRAPHAIALAIFLSVAATGSAAAQGYPTHPIRWLIGFPPGGPTDILVRLMGEWLQPRLGQPVVVENRPGAGRNIATQALVNAAPDGYMIGSVTSANAINATVNRRTLAFDFLQSLAPVAGMSQGPSVLVVNPSVPAQTLAEFGAYAKANPGKINFGSPGVGSTGHLPRERVQAGGG